MIIWLASYPKSGNTWVRSIIAALMHTDDGVFKFELLNQIKQFPSKKYFKDFTNDFENIHEIKKYWESAQDFINLDNKVKFFKTHHINCKIGQYSFTSKKNTLATIYIIRDPRNLVNSISNRFSKSVEDSKKFLFTPKIITKFEKEDDLENKSLITLLGTWNEHYKFWKNNNENFLLIKYEDLINNTNSELDKIIAFIKRFTPIQTDEIKNKNIIKTTSFNYLQNLASYRFLNSISF
ncbi:sulfotransferase [Candidatus Pelagibacter giovannonii]|uniref:Sulfotransferase n=1 Tax=Candidatus Pelagibacter giovannonii TaxID=2563896 RepID=A0A6H1Q510_9PROT|nr:sulfotransferase domain-containing protein [Candidatus Pelagibacter giovannonii]QIZ21590.1 sulfotransferase [Candidatus Pelagibacter giovannonii]